MTQQSPRRRLVADSTFQPPPLIGRPAERLERRGDPQFPLDSLLRPGDAEHRLYRWTAVTKQLHVPISESTGIHFTSRYHLICTPLQGMLISLLQLVTAPVCDSS